MAYRKIEVNTMAFREYNKEKAEREFERDRNYLNDSIKREMMDCPTSSLNLYNNILNLPDETEEDYEQKKWLWNGGCLRTEQEIIEFNRRVEEQQYYESGDYEHDMKAGWFAPAIPIIVYIIVFIITFKFDIFGDFIVFWFFLAPVALLSSLFIGWGLNSYRKNIARRANVPFNDPLYSKARQETDCYAAAAICSALSLGKSAKKCIKETSDPDKWKQMK